MRVLYIHQYFKTLDMPGGTRSYEMARRMVERGHEVHMITSDCTGHQRGGWYVTNESGIHVHWIPIPYSNLMGFEERKRAFIQFALLSLQRAVRMGGDVVFASSPPLTVAIPGIVVSILRRIPLVFEVRDLWPEAPIAMGALRNPVHKALARLLELLAYHEAAYVVTLSPGMAEGVISTGVDGARVNVIPNCCDLPLFQRACPAGEALQKVFDRVGDAPLVVYAGTLGHIHGVGYLVDIADELRRINPEVRFLIAGDGIEAAKVRRQAEDRGLLDSTVFLLPSLPKSEVPALLQHATVCTSLVINRRELWQNSANKFFDALAAGKPIMINYEGWQADLLREFGAGVVTPPDDARTSARLLNDLITDRQRLACASHASAHLARTRFDRDVLALKLADVLEATSSEAKRKNRKGIRKLARSRSPVRLTAATSPGGELHHLEGQSKT